MKTTIFILTAGLIFQAVSSRANFISESGFENPALPPYYYWYAPANTAWDFSANSGVTRIPSTWGVAVTAPEGLQAAFIQAAGSRISQQFSVASAGIFDLTYFDSGRWNSWQGFGGDATYAVNIDSIVLGILNTVSGQDFSRESFSCALSEGTHTVSFQVLSANNPAHAGDDSVLIDDVQLNLVNSVPDGGMTIFLLGITLAGLMGCFMSVAPAAR